MKLVEACPTLVADIATALLPLGRGDLVDELRSAVLSGWEFDDFAQSTLLRLGPAACGEVAEVVVLQEEIGVTLELDRDGRVRSVEVHGYEHELSGLRGA